MKILFLDTETTGLNPDLHDVWEIAAITHPTETDEVSGEHHWMVRPDLTTADPQALAIGRYYERTTASFDPPERVAADLARLLSGALVVGSNPAFDERFLSRWLRRHGQCWTAHYRTLDVITLGWGHLMGSDHEFDHAACIPPASHAISRAFGVDPDAYDRHTALGDCRWTRDVFDAVMTAKGSA